MLLNCRIASASGVRRDPLRVQRLLRSIARNVATEVSNSTLAADTRGEDGAVSRETVIDYYQALTRLMVVEDLSAWSAHLRSSAVLRKQPKRNFVDPSLAVAAVGANVDSLVADLKFLGFLFESKVVHDLRVYADTFGGKLYHYRDSSKLEVDVIIEMPDGSFGAFEIKLGFGAVDEAAQSLLAFRSVLDEKAMGAPTNFTVITGSGFAHTRPDGVNVVPLYTLTK